jgi:hypothetical protein
MTDWIKVGNELHNIRNIKSIICEEAVCTLDLKEKNHNGVATHTHIFPEKEYFDLKRYFSSNGHHKNEHHKNEHHKNGYHGQVYGGDEELN